MHWAERVTFAATCSVLLLGFLSLTSGLGECTSWVQTDQRDFLSGTLSDVDAYISPGSLVILEGLYRKTYIKTDFEDNINTNIRPCEDGITLLKYGTKVKTYSQRSKPSIGGHQITHTWQDPASGEIHVSLWGGGYTLIRSDGTSVTYRPSGVWDTTENCEGVLLREDLKIEHSNIFHVWKDVEKGDIYLSTHMCGLGIIHTQNTPDVGDDVLEVLDRDSTPALARHGPSISWRDEDGNLYVGYKHENMVTVISPEGASTTYTGSGVFDTNREPKVLISDTPRIGTAAGGDAPPINPLLKDSRGNLYVSHFEGLTVLSNTDSDEYYDTSVTYRNTGLWDTTHDSKGTLISASPCLPGRGYVIVFHAWKDENGDIYLSLSNGYLSVLHPDGTLENIKLVAWNRSVNHSWRDSGGDLYISTREGLFVMHPDGGMTVYDRSTDPLLGSVLISWADPEGYLYAVNGTSFIDVIAPNREGSSISDVIPTQIPARSIRWSVITPPGSRVVVQTRTGTTDSYWIEEFQGELEPEVEPTARSRPFDVGVAEGVLVFDNFSRNISFFIGTGKPEAYFPTGSLVRARVRLGALKEKTKINIFTDDESPDEGTMCWIPNDRWVVVSHTSEWAFSKIGLSVPLGQRFEIDWVSVQLAGRWSDWVDAENSYGSAISDLDEDHPYLQWRALFTTDDPVDVLPELKEVSIVSGYPESVTYISPAFDAQESSVFEKIYWDAEVPVGTSLKFQIRTAPTEGGLKDAPWLGPGDDEEFYVTSGTPINPVHSGDRWIQYRAVFQTQDEARTPVLKEVRVDYNIITTVEEDAGEGSMPSETGLFQNYPNPFNLKTTIRYTLPWKSRVRLTIYSLSGQKIRMLVDDEKQAGSYSVVWDGRDDNGAAVASGIYFYRLEVREEFSKVKRMVLIR